MIRLFLTSCPQSAALLYINNPVPNEGGGVAVVCRSNLSVENKTRHSFKSFECLDISIRSRGQLLRIIVVYRPPKSKANGASSTDFFNDFPSLLEEVIPSPGRLLIVGDFNFHVDNAESRDALIFMDLLESRGLQQHVTDPTHVKGHTLDLLITRATDNLIQSVNVSDILISDHSLVQFSANVSRPPNKKTTRSFRKYNEIDCDILKSKITSSFVDFSHFSDPDELCEFYSQNLSIIVDELAPLTTKTSTDKPRAPWYSKELMDMRCAVRQHERH